MTPLNLIHQKVAEHYGIDGQKMFVNKREGDIVFYRQIFYYIADDLNHKYNMPYRVMGAYFNNTHSTVIHSINKIEGFKRFYADIRDSIEKIKEEIKCTRT